MARKISNLNNPPPMRFERRLRLIVKARKALPKMFIWEIVQDDGKGNTTLQKTSDRAFETMEAAYTAGTDFMNHYKSP